MYLFSFVQICSAEAENAVWPDLKQTKEPLSAALRQAADRNRWRHESEADLWSGGPQQC